MNDRTELTWQIREIQIFYIMNITLGRNLPHPTSVGPMKAASFIFTPHNGGHRMWHSINVSLV